MSASLSAAEFLPPSAGPLSEMLETYAHCLALSRDYVENNLKAPDDDGDEADVDVDRLDQFLKARAELFAVAESSFNSLAGYYDGASASDEAARKELTGRVVAVLEEMTVMEHQLASFLGDRLGRMRDTIDQMKRSQPVFKRYARLGPRRLEPIHITRQS